jgi:carbamoyl-phosphate synthase small subunit
MRTFSHIIKDAGGSTALARKIGEDPNTVHAWKRGKSIPAAHWNAVVAAKLATLQELADAAEHRRLQPAASPEPANDASPEDPEVRQRAA